MTHKDYAVYQKLEFRYFDDLIKKIRGQVENTTLITPNKKGFKTVYRKCAKIEIISGLMVLVSDQSPTSKKGLNIGGEFYGGQGAYFNGQKVWPEKLDRGSFLKKYPKLKRGYYKAEFITITTTAKQTNKHEITDRFLRIDQTSKILGNNRKSTLRPIKRWTQEIKYLANFN